MSFTFDPAYRVVVAEFTDCDLVTDADVERWRSEVAAHLEGFGAKVDLLIDLEGLRVRPSAARAFGRARAGVLAAYARRSFRFHGNPQTRTSIYSSYVLDAAPTNLYPSRQEALAALLADRRGSNE